MKLENEINNKYIMKEENNIFKYSVNTLTQTRQYPVTPTRSQPKHGKEKSNLLHNFPFPKFTLHQTPHESPMFLHCILLKVVSLFYFSHFVSY